MFAATGCVQLQSSVHNLHNYVTCSSQSAMNARVWDDLSSVSPAAPLCGGKCWVQPAVTAATALRLRR
eukprot:2538833-Amphidinium_carterae.1